MQILEFLPFEQTLAATQFNQLRELLQQVAQDVGALVLTEEFLSPQAAVSSESEGFEAERPEREISENKLSGTSSFLLVAAEQFSALLCARPDRPPSGQPTSDRPAVYQISLTFAPDTIAAFLNRLAAASIPGLSQTLEQARSVLRPNNAQMQSQFTLRLIALLSGTTTSAVPELAVPELAVPELAVPELAVPELTLPEETEAAEITLRQQIQQERLLNQVMTQIRQSLELPAILQTAVEQVRQVLRVDRIVIYCLDLDTLRPAALDETDVANAAASTPEVNNADSPASVRADAIGSVIYEARISESTPSVLNFTEAHCFVSVSDPSDLREKDLAIAIADTEIKYAAAPCLLRFLRQARVRAKLVAPILIRDRLWGLLIAHQCTHPRQWQNNEQRFLQQIAEHLSIAISQAQLYAELQQQKHTLEQRVARRTQELQDVMQAAQSANRAKSEFLAAVSHELRTPLTCIIGMSTTLQRWMNDDLNDRQRNFLQTIHDSGEYLLTLINDILDLSQVEAGKMLLTLSEFSLSRLSQQSLKTFEGQAALNDITLELDLRTTPQSDRFVADPRRVQQILFNLLDNAIKFTPSGGKVLLRVQVEENLAVFQVKDHGIGIPEQQLSLLFEKFRQLNAGYQRQYRGTGLGLALTKQLVELHGGWIAVESTVGVGSVFTVRLPMQSLVDRGQQMPKTRSLTVSNRVRGRIVLIEHQEEPASLICDILTAAGYQIIWITEGSSAMDQLEVLRPAAVIAESHLPDIDGYVLIQQLRQNPATKSLKVIVLMPDLSEQESNRWQTAGGDRCLVQPIRPDRLLQTVLALTNP